jgi:geranylgeranyl reductase family protein
MKRDGLSKLHTAHVVTSSCDTLVVGAGPAGSSCAHWLARHGREVLLVDQHRFPRHKICGDALIPDALEVLERLGLLSDVMAHSQATDHVRCVAPSKHWVDLSAPMAVISRFVLDEILLKAAVKQGVRFQPGLCLEAVSRDPNRASTVNGAWFRKAGERVFIPARQLVLATGASSSALEAAGVTYRRAPSAMAMRAIIRHPGMRKEVEGLQIFWHRAIRPGYAWLFPMQDHTYNLGVGVFDVEKDWPNQKVNLRNIFNRLLEVNPLVARLLREGETIGQLKGAPLRSGLSGAPPAQDGLLICGEAVGSTYGLSGEGIGKAMETGLMAATSLLTSHAHQGLEAMRPGPIYEAALDALRMRYAQYEKANRINRQPWFAELLIRLASRSAHLRFQASEVLNERRSPEDLVTIGGILGMLWKKS